MLLTGNGINDQVRSLVAAQSERDVFLDARESVHRAYLNEPLSRSSEAALLRLDETWTGTDGKMYSWNTTLAPMA